MKLTACLSVIVFLCIAATATAGTYSGGTGEPNDPYRIATAEDLNDIGNHPDDWDKHFLLVADINMAGITGSRFNMIGDFSGVFDGGGHFISGFTFRSTLDPYVGLFARVSGSHALIEDLAFIEPNVAGGSTVGCLVGRLRGKISNCHVLGGSVSGMHSVGGLVGRHDSRREISGCRVQTFVSGYGGVGGLVGNIGGYGKIRDCYSAAVVTGGSAVGGLVGGNGKGSISDCYAVGSVDGNDYTGGLVGGNGGSIHDCAAFGTVTGVNGTGGLIGDNDGSVSNCRATGTVSGVSRTGGLIGSNHGYDISSCYATGRVTGDSETGGLVGYNSHRISNCYALGPVDGNDKTGGLLGHNVCYAEVSNCYAVGRVSGSNDVGGLVGHHHENLPLCYTHYTRCFWDRSVNPPLEGIGNASDPNVIGAPTVLMKQERTFRIAGWDFADIWNIGEYQTYPYLRRYSPGDLNHDGIVNFPDFAILAARWLEQH